MNKTIYKNIIAFHPGYYVQELLGEFAMSQKELAQRLDTTEKTVSLLLNGKAPLSNRMANGLAIVFGTSVNLWLNLNAQYNAKIIEIDRQKGDEAQEEILRMLDYAYFVTNGFVEKTESLAQRVLNLQRFLRVSDLNVLKKRDYLIQSRIFGSPGAEMNNVRANAWIQTAMTVGGETEAPEFNEQALMDALPKIRALAEDDSDSSLVKIQSLLNACGVVLIVLPDLANCGLCGAVKWLTRDRAMIVINQRNSDWHAFWFLIFHELGYVFQKQYARIIVLDNSLMLAQPDWRFSALDVEPGIIDTVIREAEEEFAENGVLFDAREAFSSLRSRPRH